MFAWAPRFSGAEQTPNCGGPKGTKIKQMDAIGAKQFFISKVIEEAEFEHIKLSTIEKKMLYFTEAHPSLPDIYEVNTEFERDYDTEEYEQKIAGLLRNSRSRDSHTFPSLQEWEEAIEALKKEDHYILVMLDRAFPEYRKTLLPTHRVRNYLIDIAIGLTVVIVAIGIAIWSH